MATQESKDLGQLNPEEVSHVILKAHDKGMSWESEDMQVLAALLELRMPTLQFPAQSLRCAHHLGDSIDTLATRAMACHLPEVSATNPRVHQVAGDGNCLDNATLYDLVGNWRDAFSWRVRKGLHFLQNVAWYTVVLASANEIGEPNEFNQFIQRFFWDKNFQSPFHDLPAATLLERPIAIWVPSLKVREVIGSSEYTH